MDSESYCRLEDIENLLIDVGFSRSLVGIIDPGCFITIKANSIEVYLGRGMLVINKTLKTLKLDLYKSCGGGSYFSSKQKIYKLESGLSEFRDFLLESIIRDSFLTGEEELVTNNKINKIRRDWWI